MTPEITLFCAVWNTAHLFRRSVETYLAQDLDPNRWELVVIDDNSPDHDKIVEALHLLDGKVDYRLIRLEHDHGMRGNTISFNTATQAAYAPILMETTPECLLPKDALTKLLLPHYQQDNLFVAMKTYNLTMGGQLGIESGDWRAGWRGCTGIPDWNSDWTQHNVPVVHFGTHQICSYRKAMFMRLNNGNMWPLFGDYGTDDPFFAHQRPLLGFVDVTLPNEDMAVHQWHAPFMFWMAYGLAPHLNKHAHSTSNYLHDTSGFVPEQGTRVIWGQGPEPLSAEEAEGWKRLSGAVRETGGTPPEDW